MHNAAVQSTSNQINSIKCKLPFNQKQQQHHTEGNTTRQIFQGSITRERLTYVNECKTRNYSLQGHPRSVCLLLLELCHKLHLCELKTKMPAKSRLKMRTILFRLLIAGELIILLEITIIYILSG